MMVTSAPQAEGAQTWKSIDFETIKLFQCNTRPCQGFSISEMLKRLLVALPSFRNLKMTLINQQICVYLQICFY